MCSCPQDLSGSFVIFRRSSRWRQILPNRVKILRTIRLSMPKSNSLSKSPSIEKVGTQKLRWKVIELRKAAVLSELNTLFSFSEFHHLLPSFLNLVLIRFKPLPTSLYGEDMTWTRPDKLTWNSDRYNQPLQYQIGTSSRTLT